MHDEGEQRDQRKAEHDAELLGRDREHEVGMAVRQDALHRAPRPDRGRTSRRAMKDSDRDVDLIGVARGRVHEALDAPGHVRHRSSRRRRDLPRRRRRGPATQIMRMPAMKNSAPPHQRDQHGLAEVGLQHQDGDDAPSSANAMVLAGMSGLRGFAEQPRDQNDEGGLEEFGL